MVYCGNGLDVFMHTTEPHAALRTINISALHTIIYHCFSNHVRYITYTTKTMKQTPDPNSKNTLKKIARKTEAASIKKFPVAHKLVRHLRLAECHPFYCAPFTDYYVTDDGSVIIDQQYKLTITSI